MHDSEGVLGPAVIEFVEHHVSTLLAWDIVVFFHRNADVRLEVEDLAARLGRHAQEIEPEIDALCDGDVLACDLGAIRYEPSDQMRTQVNEFVAACQDRGQRLALIALVLGRMGRHAAGND